MSRSGYTDDYDGDGYSLDLYRRAVEMATRGERGQKLLSDLCAALDAMPVKELIANELVTNEGAVCALGALGKVRGVDMNKIDPEDASTVGRTFGCATSLAREVVYANDEEGPIGETPAQRWQRMRAWVASQIDLG